LHESARDYHSEEDETKKAAIKLNALESTSNVRKAARSKRLYWSLVTMQPPYRLKSRMYPQFGLKRIYRCFRREKVY